MNTGVLPGFRSEGLCHGIILLQKRGKDIQKSRIYRFEHPWKAVLYEKLSGNPKTRQNGYNETGHNREQTRRKCCTEKQDEATDKGILSTE